MAKPTEVERFWAKVDRSGGPDACWPWLRSIRNGYGTVSVGKTSMQASRYAWIATHGPIPSGLEIDHLCHNRDQACSGGITCLHRRCVNPAHLEPVTRSVNVIRAARRKPTCYMGHLMSGENVYVNPAGYRKCMECARARRRRYNPHRIDRLLTRRVPVPPTEG